MDEQTKSNGKSVQGAEVPPATREQVRNFVRQDLTAARYFLAVLLDRYPLIVSEIADSMYDKAHTAENGAAIDHVEKTHV